MKNLVLAFGAIILLGFYSCGGVKQTKPPAKDEKKTGDTQKTGNGTTVQETAYLSVSVLMDAENRIAQIQSSDFYVVKGENKPENQIEMKSDARMILNFVIDNTKKDAVEMVAKGRALSVSEQKVPEKVSVDPTVAPILEMDAQVNLGDAYKLDKPFALPAPVYVTSDAEVTKDNLKDKLNVTVTIQKKSPGKIGNIWKGEAAQGDNVLKPQDTKCYVVTQDVNDKGKAFEFVSANNTELNTSGKDMSELKVGDQVGQLVCVGTIQTKVGKTSFVISTQIGTPIGKDKSITIVEEDKPVPAEQ